ncbi:myosin-13-like isoform X1 [Hydractinia symbiolongicarpus]|uniref:myosin-13-like isoform X1 n=1 Tax=Hydractinia symbiolongicarpus TaxID=13093 RepID=UPI002551AA7C|nr:myosin-13-like isoform X1 [Hydractinia symbiolongicarpus]
MSTNSDDVSSVEYEQMEASFESIFGSSNETIFGDLSMTLKEIDETLQEQNADHLLDNINDSSHFLKELITKQQRSHQKIQIHTNLVFLFLVVCSLQLGPKKSNIIMDDLKASTKKSQLNNAESNVLLRSLSLSFTDNSSQLSHEQEVSVIAKDSISCPASRNQMEVESEYSLGSYFEVTSTSLHRQTHFDEANSGTTSGFSCSGENELFLPISLEMGAVNVNNRKHNEIKFLTEKDKAGNLVNGEPINRPLVDIGNENISVEQISKGKKETSVHTALSVSASKIVDEQIKEGEETDNLLLYFDLMSAHIQEMKLEKERMKLDVLVALRTKLQNVYDGESLEKIPAKFAEKINDNLCEVMIAEVMRVKEEEEAKCTKEKEGYLLQIKKMSSELAELAKEKCELSVELNTYKEHLSKLKESFDKSDNLENRVVYLEDLLRSVEKENEKLKVDTWQLRKENEKVNKKVRDLDHACEDSCRKYDCLKMSEKTMRQTTRQEIVNLIAQNKKANDELFTVKNQKENLRLELERAKNSKETDLTIIKRLEEKLNSQKSFLQNMHEDSNKNFENNLKLESKATEYKQKLKKCVNVLEAARKENKRLSDNAHALQNEIDECRTVKHNLKMKESDLILQHAKERTELENTVNKLTENEHILKEKLQTLERAMQYYKNTLKTQTLVTDTLNWSTLRKKNKLLKDTTSDNSHVNFIKLAAPQTRVLASSTANIPPVNLSKSLNFRHSSTANSNTNLESFYETKNSWRKPPTSPVHHLPPQSGHINSSEERVFQFHGDTANVDGTMIYGTGYVSPFVNNKLKYSEDDTRLFLKEMTYKLEHTENALKLADQDEYMSSLLTGKNLEERVQTLRSEVMRL